VSKTISYPKFELKDTLSKEEKDFFNANGFIHYKNFITRERAQTVSAAIDEKQKVLISKGVSKINGIPIKFGEDENKQPIIQRFLYTSHNVPEVAALYDDSRLQNLKELLPDAGYPRRIGLNEKDGVVANHYVNTETSNYKQLGWHTDVARDFLLGKGLYPMLNIGIYLTDSGPENGGLRTLPGTHKQNAFQTMFKKLQVLNTKEDPDEVSMEAESGDLCIHDGRLWHRVAMSPHIGEKSHRRVMYVSMLSGPADERNSKSKTPFYLRFLKLAK